MKKIVALMLALMLVMAMSISAFADDANITGYEDEDGKRTSSVGNGTTFTINKTLSTTNDGTLFPKDALDFDIELIGAYADADHEVEITGDNDATINIAEYKEGDESVTLTIGLPNYTTPGIYYYTITETSDILGVVEPENPWSMKVTVIQDPANTISKSLMVAGIAIREGEGEVDQGEKIDEIDNTFNAGSIEVQKIISGNAADLASTWDFELQFENNTGKDIGSTITYKIVNGTTTKVAEQTITSANFDDVVEFTLGHEDKIVITNIPYGVEYTITETNANTDGYETENEEITGEIGEDNYEVSETVTNSKQIDIDTGIALDSIPYIMMMAVAMMGIAVLALRRRKEEL